MQMPIAMLIIDDVGRVCSVLDQHRGELVAKRVEVILVVCSIRTSP